MAWPHATRSYATRQINHKPHRQHVALWYCNPSTDEARYSAGRILARLVNDCPDCGVDLNVTRCNCIGD